MLREHFSAELVQLQVNLTTLGELVKTATRLAVEALLRRDNILAGQVIENDTVINQLRFRWEEQALQLLATQNPVARDLRVIAAGIHIVDDLERMGDHAKGIARISQLMGDNPLVCPGLPLDTMAQKVCELLNLALASFSNRDANLAGVVGRRDDEVDEMYNRIAAELFEIMFSDRGKVGEANHLLWAAHHLERIADRTTNICERVIFVCTGQMEEIPGMSSRLNSHK
ncbi:MAG: phosphate transport system regulatory protein PhoU [Chloroflexi bacterium 54-19]|nr:MAG: phosphate transport system regulatory protein PhoU [Chloroflexi bacterium 54-19]